MKFEPGEVVSVKAGVKPDFLDLDLSGWQGRVLAIRGKRIEVEWDSETLSQLPQAYLDASEEDGSYPFTMLFPPKDLEAATARDREQDMRDAQDQLFEKMESLYGTGGYSQEVHKWMWQFERSEFYRRLGEVERENMPFIIQTFSDYMYDYQGQEPQQWTARSMEEVCLDIVPRKISAEPEVFQSYGKVLLHFFEFLQQKHILNTRSLISGVKKISDQIYEYSQDASNWGMAKSFMMGAQSSGVDVEDKEALNEYLYQQNRLTIDRLSTEAMARKLPEVPHNPYRHIGRNQKVSVRYQDGKEVRAIKFKKVARDLEAGSCMLIEE